MARAWRWRGTFEVSEIAKTFKMALFAMACARRQAVTFLFSHAYTEYGHVAQCFALPKFGGTRHDVLLR